MKGFITEIQHSSVHDGPGIRTTVFLKGCNMHCAWCHNPETVYPGKEILHSPEKCIGCGRCEEGCFSGARVEVGREVTVEQVLAEALADKIYYGQDGGVTVTGGEPLMQAAFTEALLKACREAGISPAMETNLSMPKETVIACARLCDLVMCDLKLWDEVAHLRYTGLTNKRVKENLRAVSALGIPMVVRTPLMRDVNDRVEEIAAIADYIAELSGSITYELLTYHPLGVSKGASEHFKPERFERPARETVALLARTAREKGLSVRVDGVPFIS